MALYRWQRTIVDGEGNVLPGASVEFRDEDTGSLVQLYTDRAGTVSAGNPVTADNNGYVFVYLIPARLKITATSGSSSQSWRDVLLPLDRRVRYVDSLADLQELEGNDEESVAYMVGRTTAGDGGEGEFRWDGSDLSSKVAADTGKLFYVAPTSDPTGAGGAWVRQRLPDLKNKIAGQQNFIELSKKVFQPEIMRVSRVSSPYEAIRVSMILGSKHVSYEFRKNTNDDYWIFHAAFFGDVNLFESTSVNADTLVGTWIGPDGSNNIYTTTIGDYLEFTVSGTDIEVHHLDDDRGGIMEAQIDGNPETAVTYSTYGTSLAVVAKTIATGLENKSHTVRLTFKGDDPDNPPSGGTSRGWAMDGYSGTNSLRYTATGGTAFGGAYTDNTLALGYASNKEIALLIDYGGEQQWFPEHNGIGTAVEATAPIIKIDGISYAISDLALDVVYDASTVEFLQHVTAQFPLTAPTDVLDAKVNFQITDSNVVNVSGVVEFLESSTVVSGYSMMFPIVAGTIDRLVSGIGNEYTSLGDDSVTHLWQESDEVFSYGATGSASPDALSAVEVDMILNSLRIGQQGRGDKYTFAFLQNRPTYPKLYLSAYSNHPVSSGDKYKFAGSYSVALMSGAHETL